MSKVAYWNPAKDLGAWALKNGPMLLVFCGLITFMSGCAFIDGIFGVKGGVKQPGTSPAEAVGSVLGVWIPGAGALASALGGLWAAIRGRNWKRVALSTIETVEAGARAGKSVESLKNDLAIAHEKAGVKGIVQAVVDKYGHTEDTPLSGGP